MAKPNPFFVGRDCKLKFFIAGVSIGELDAKSFNVKKVATAVADGIIGEDRDRLDSIVNHYELKLTCHNADLKKLVALLADQELIDEGGIPTDQAMAIVIRPKDGSKTGFQASEAVFDDWSFDIGGMTERAMLEIPIRCRYFKAVNI